MQGRVIATDTSHGYTSIHLNTDGYIQGLSYLGTESLQQDNIFSLFGIHEKCLNRMIARFDFTENGGIKDLKR